MKFCDKMIQDHLLAGGAITHSDLKYPIFLGDNYNGDTTIVYTTDDDGLFEYCLCQTDLERNDWKIANNYYEDIIANKILCLFWNKDNDMMNVGYLKKVKSLDENACFFAEVLTDTLLAQGYFKNCKPLEGNKFNILP